MKKILAIFLILAMALSMTACGAPAAAPAVETTAAQTAAPTTEAVETAETGCYPITVTDQAGRTVTIEAQPERIVSGYYISSSLLMALGQADKLVGIEAKADKRAIYRLSAPALQQLPSVGTAKEFDLEGCAALEPDLVILPMKLKDAASTLGELGIPAIVVNPENQQLLNETIGLVAEALNCEDAAKELFLFINQTIEDLFKARNTDPDAQIPVVYMAGNSSLLSTAGGSMYQSSLIELAGGRNAAAEIEDSYWAEVSYEQLLAWNPDVIVLASDAGYSPEDVLADPNLAGITAIESGRVYQMPSRAEAWDSPVPGGILGAVWMASVLHPEQVSQEACNAVIEEFYETFYGFSYENSEN